MIFNIGESHLYKGPISLVCLYKVFTDPFIYINKNLVDNYLFDEDLD